MPGANWLFVQTADSITTDGKTITLKGVKPQTLMFTDRPERMTGDASTEKFVAFWKSGQGDFEKDPPNATISTVVDGKPELAVVELTNPQLSGDSLTYTIKVLGMEPPKAGQAASLFIDWWYGPRWGWRSWAGGYCWRGPLGRSALPPALGVVIADTESRSWHQSPPALDRAGGTLSATCNIEWRGQMTGSSDLRPPTHNALTISSVIFLASPNSIMVLSR